MKSIIIAKYKENIEWISKIPSGWNIYVLDKDMNMFNAVGREAHTYFKFIVDNYDSLEGDYIFCQGNPFDHCPTFLDEIYLGEISGKSYPCTRTNRGLPVDNFKALEMDKYIRLLKLDIPNEWEFLAGGQFKTKASNIKKRTKDFYQTCLDLTITDPQSGYIFEGLWKFII